MGSHSSVSRRPCWASLAKTALGAAVALGGLAAGQAHALVVNVPGYGHWDITTFTESYDDNSTKFAQLPAPGVMPWWSSQAAALAFANAARNQLPSLTCNLCDPVTTEGPYFGYGAVVGATGTRIEFSNFQYPTFNIAAGGAVLRSQPGYFRSVWAQATPAAIPTPGPLPALGVVAAFGYSRKLRNRIKSCGNSAPSTDAL